MDIPSIDTADAAKALGVCHKTIMRWIKSGKLQAVKVGGRYRTTEAWIRAVVEPVESPELPHRKGAQISDSKATRARIKARFGI